MRKNKVGIMFLVSMLAMAGIGISYAGWTDTISVEGTVSTGNVDINLVAYSGTWVYKLEDHGIARVHNRYYPTPTHEVPTGAIFVEPNGWVAAGYATPTVGADNLIVDDAVTLTYVNLFPCQDMVADFILHYDGSIPARVTGPIIIATTSSENGLNFKGSGMNWLEYLYTMYDQTPYGIKINAYRIYPPENGQGNSNDWNDWVIAEDEPVLPGYQLEECNYVYVEVIIHIPQDPHYMGLSGTFSTTLEVKQWNEVVI